MTGLGTALTGTGQDPAAWRRRLAVAPAVADLGLSPGSRALVLAAHPDDETLGLGGVVHRLCSTGVHVHVVVATDGEAAHGAAGDRRLLAATRRDEVRAATVALGVAQVPALLGLPDGELAGHECDLRAALAGAGSAPDVLFAPWRGDPHPDHRAAGRVAAAVAGRLGRPLWEYPIWMRHWTAPEDPTVGEGRLVTVRLTAAERAAKHAAIGCHLSQTSDLGPGLGAVLPAYVLSHFTDEWEPLFGPEVVR